MEHHGETERTPSEDEQGAYRLAENVWLVKVRHGLTTSKKFLDFVQRIKLSRDITRIDSATYPHYLVYGNVRGITRLRQSANISCAKLHEGEMYCMTICVWNSDDDRHTWRTEWIRITTILQELLLNDDVLDIKIAAEDEEGARLELVVSAEVATILETAAKQSELLTCTHIARY